MASSVVNLSTIFKTKLLSNKLCQRKKKKRQQCTNNVHMTHISQKLNFPLCPFTVLTIVTALPHFLFSACFCTHCVLHFLFLHCLFMLCLFSCVDKRRTWAGLQNVFFLLLLAPDHNQLINHMFSKHAAKCFECKHVITCRKCCCSC